MPNMSPSSLWNVPVAKKPKVKSTCLFGGAELDHVEWAPQCWLQTIAKLHEDSSQVLGTLQIDMVLEDAFPPQGMN